MRKLLTSTAFVALVLGLFATPSVAQTSLDDVRLFQSHFRDAPISSSAYVEGDVTYSSFDNAIADFSVLGIEARVGVPIQGVFELGAEDAYLMYNVEGAEDEPSGIDRPRVYGRYNLLNDGEMSVALGGTVALPIGSEEIVGEDPGVDFGFFGAGRYLVANNIALTGTAGIDLVEIADDRETDFVLGLGTVIGTSERLNLVGEMKFTTETEYAALSGGIDYQISNAARIRAAALVGLDDGAADFGIQAGVLFHFGR